MGYFLTTLPMTRNSMHYFKLYQEVETLSNGKGDQSSTQIIELLHYFQTRVSYNRSNIASGWGFATISFNHRVYKGSTNRLVEMISRLPTSNIIALETKMHMDPFTNDAYREANTKYEELKEVFYQL
jgi:hypothetical protein